MSGVASNEAAPAPVTAEQGHAEFQKLLHDRNHMGVRNFLGDIALESRNPFQRAHRSPKKWVLAVAVIFVLGLSIVYWFHLR